MEIHSINENGKTSSYKHMPARLEKKIEDTIENNPDILEKDLIIIGRQVETSDGKIVDLIGLDKKGDTVIVELKKDQAPRKVISQILDYGQWAEDELGYETLNYIAKQNHLPDHNSLMEKFIDWTGDVEPEFNQNQKLYVVAESIDDKTAKLARYLRQKGIPIFCVELNFYEKEGHQLIQKRIIVGKEKISFQKTDVPHTEEIHIQKGNEKTKKLYQKLKAKVMKLGSDVKMTPVKYYIGFARHSNFLVIKFRKDLLRIEFIAKEGFKDEKKLTTVFARKKYGGRLRTMNIRSEKEISDLMELIKQNYKLS